jgi:hypothetical protein
MMEHGALPRGAEVRLQLIEAAIMGIVRPEAPSVVVNKIECSARLV